MGAGRIIHALPVFSSNTKTYKLLFEPIAPINILLSYAYLRGSTVGDAVRRLKDMSPLFEGRILVIDCGIYTFKGELGLTAQAKDTEHQYQTIREEMLSRYGEFEDYVREYGAFLKETYDLYTYAFDFDSDPLMGPEVADRLSQTLFDTVGDKILRKIARIYHIARGPNATDWWRELCADPRFDYVAIEGGQMHRATPEFYKYLIDIAHKGGKKVHVLAISGVTFPRDIPADYMDCSTYSMGGRKALLQTPYGTVQIGKYISARHISRKPKHIQEAVEKFVRRYGFTLEELMAEPDGAYLRQRFNVQFINEFWDIPYIPPQSEMGRLF